MGCNWTAGRGESMLRKKSVLIIGSYGRGNVGDDMFLSAAVPLFRKYNIYINSANDSLLPSDAIGHVETISTSMLRDISHKIKTFFQIRAIVYWGGDVWVKYYGDTFPRQPLYKMIALNTVARLTGKKVHYLGCGIGNLKGYDLFLARISAKLANSIVVRESKSSRKLGMKNIVTLPDIATTIPYYPDSPKTIRNDKKFVIAISVLYYIPNPQISFPQLIEDIADFVKSLPHDKFEFVLFPMLVSKDAQNDDNWASQELSKLIPNHYNVSVLKPMTLEQTMKAIHEFDLIVGTRLHANILGTLSGVPCIGVSYRPKVASFFSDNGLSEYCLEIDETKNIRNLFDEIYNNYNKTADRFYEVSKRNIAEGKEYQKNIDNII